MAGTEAQKEQWLRPLVEGEIQSAFSMTEPAQGGGSDPKIPNTSAVKDRDERVINGHKWWTSAGSVADILLAMARTDLDARPYGGTSIILVPTDADGMNTVRDGGHVGGHGIVKESPGHAEAKYEDVQVPVESAIGPEGGGFEAAQMRLAGGRLTHCMRYSTMAERALDISSAYLSEREAFGESVSKKQALCHELAYA